MKDFKQIKIRSCGIFSMIFITKKDIVLPVVLITKRLIRLWTSTVVLPSSPSKLINTEKTTYVEKI
jgi:hypothetical protein